MSTRKPAPKDIWTEDLVLQSARSLVIGRELCTCVGLYHSLWGALRLANLDKKQEAEVPVLASTLLPLIAQDTRVLIAGSADPGLLCKVGRISSDYGAEITIVERCAAPLKLIDEFAAGRKIACRMIHSDILDLEGVLKWDVILLHYTVTFVEREHRKRLFDRLARSLAPGGTLLCIIRKGKPTDPSELETLEAAYYRESLEALRQHHLDSYWKNSELEKLLHIYAAERARRKVFQPSVEELECLLQCAGLKLTSEVGTGLKRVLNTDASASADVESSSIVSARHHRLGAPHHMAAPAPKS